jgi:hypothetical protein
LKYTPLPPLPGQEPKRDRSDPALFDRFNATRASKLFDEDLPDHIEERSEKKPYTLSPKRRLRPFRSPSGEVVQRYRGGKGYTPIYAPWSPEGLLRVRGRLMAVLKPTDVGGRTLSWADHPFGWGAIEPELPVPYVLRQVIKLALDGADVSGSNVPAAAELVERTLRANRLGALDLGLGPRMREGDEPERIVPPWTAEDARQIRLFELEDAQRKADASKHRVKTSEYRNEDHGEYGPQSRMTRDGRVAFGRNGLPALNNQRTELRGLNDQQKRTMRLASGRTKKVDGQMAVIRLDKPGPKPKHGFALDDRLRQIKRRCKKRGVPFILAQHLKPKKAKEPEHEYDDS